MPSITLADAVNSALREEMQRDKSVVVMGEDMAGGLGVPGFENKDAWGGVLGITRNLIDDFGRHRVIDTPISESAFIGAATGAALAGYLRPVVELQFIDFMGVCLDQIFNQAARLRATSGGQGSVPIVIRCMVGGGTRAAAHNAGSYYSVFTHFPGLKVVMPSNPYDAKGLLKAAIRDDDPVIYCEPKALYESSGEVPDDDYIVDIGKADIKRAGEDVTVVALGACVPTALKAASALGNSNDVSVEVIDPRSLSPLDEHAILMSVNKTGRLVVVDEANPRCSLAADIIAMVARKGLSSLSSPPVAITAPHSPVPFAPNLEDAYLPSPEKVEDAVLRCLRIGASDRPISHAR